jgi:hypothetical protein
MYKLRKTHGEIGSVIRTEDGAFIPFAEDNTDYIAYLAWIEAGNTPEPAEENT